MSRATELALNHGRLYHTLGTAYWGFSSAQLEAFYHAAQAEALRKAASMTSRPERKSRRR